MEIIDYTPTTAANPYLKDVADLIAAGENKAGFIDVPTDKKNAHRRNFSKAANASDKTAKLVYEEALKNEDESLTGQTRLVFVLTKKHEARRGKDETATEDATEALTEDAIEAPAEAVEEFTGEPAARRNKR